MLGEMELKVKINIEELDKIINKRDCRKNTYMIMNKETAEYLKNSKVDSYSYIFTGHWKGCEVLFCDSIEFGKIEILQ